MTNTQTKELHDDASDDSTWSSANKLSRKVRELAHRSFHILKTGPHAAARTQARSNEVGQDLRELRDQVARLQRKIHDRHLVALIPWVDALRRQVEERLFHAGKAEE